MRRLVLLFMLLVPFTVFAQTGAIQNHCFLGGTKSVTQGMNSSNYLNGIIPSCTVTVYHSGTLTKATIYADSIGTPLANPFTAHTSASVDPGGWLFYAALGTGYDVVMSGGIAPNTYPAPVTLTNVFAGGSGGPAGEYVSLIDTSPQTMAGPLFLPQLTQNIFVGSQPNVTCNGVANDRPGIQAILDAQAALGAGHSLNLIFPQTANYTGGATTACMIDSPLQVTSSGVRFICLGPQTDGSSGCALQTASGFTGSQMINVHVGAGTSQDPLFQSVGMTYIGDAANTSTIDGINIVSDGNDTPGTPGGNIDSSITGHNMFQNLHYGVVANGRNLTVEDNVFAETVGAVQILNTVGSGAAFQAYTRTDLREYKFNRNKLEAVGGTCGTGNQPAFSFPNSLAGVVKNIQIQGNHHLASGYSILMTQYNAYNVQVSGNQIFGAHGGFGNNVGGTNVQFVGNELYGYAPWSGLASCNLDADGIFGSNVFSAVIADNIIELIGDHGIQFTGTNQQLAIGHNAIYNAGAQATSTYDGIQVASGATNLTIDHNVIGADSTSYFRYGVNAVDGATALVFGNQVTNPGTSAYPVTTSGGLNSLTLSSGLTTSSITGISSPLTLFGSSASTVGIGINTAGDLIVPAGASVVGPGVLQLYGASASSVGPQIDSAGDIQIPAHINQSATKNFAGICTMSSGTCGVQSFVVGYSSVPSCACSWTGNGTLTGLIKCSATTGGINPTSSIGTDSAEISWSCIGNPD